MRRYDTGGNIVNRNCINTKSVKGKTCRSAAMEVEEIRQERERSGWNPYEGEEEEAEMRPYFMHPEFSEVLEEQKQIERDLRMLQSMYPQGIKMLLPYIEEECDKMEYEGSSMYAQYPDQTMVRTIQDRIYNQVKDQFPVSEPEPPDMLLSMQYGGSRRNPRGKNWLDDIIRVLLLQEMHHRRCRHRGCRRNW